MDLRLDRGRRKDAQLQVVFAIFRCDAAAIEQKSIGTVFSVADRLDTVMSKYSEMNHYFTSKSVFLE